MYEYEIITDEQASLDPLEGRTVAAIGYGNQGRAQALNIRDSGVNIIVGNRGDTYRKQAVEDGFEATDIPEAAEKGDILLMLVPDEAQRDLYREYIEPHLKPGNCLVFAHGYNLYYDLIEAPEGVDVVMVAPRMIGRGVRDLYEKGSGASSYCAVHVDATGNAKDICLAIAKAIGSLRVGSILSSVALETEIDLFMEQATWAATVAVLTTTFDVLVEAGFPPEIVCHETWGSKEAAEIFEACADVGLMGQLSLHSRTSQFGQLSRGPMVIGDELKARFGERLADIRNGKFAQEWELERVLGYPHFKKLRENALSHPINAAEKKMREME